MDTFKKFVKSKDSFKETQGTISLEESESGKIFIFRKDQFNTDSSCVSDILSCDFGTTFRIHKMTSPSWKKYEEALFMADFDQPDPYLGA